MGTTVRRRWSGWNPSVTYVCRPIMERNTEGLLTDTERAELETLVELSETLSLGRKQR